VAKPDATEWREFEPCAERPVHRPRANRAARSWSATSAAHRGPISSIFATP
jgi:hypothetical protein